MWTTEGERLFHDGWLHDHLRERSADIRPQVESIPKGEFQESDEYLIARALAELRVEPLILDRDSMELAFEDATLDASRDPERAAYHFPEDGRVPMPATRHVFSIPFTGSPELWHLAPNMFASVYARGSVCADNHAGTLELVFTLPKDVSHERIQEQLDAELKIVDDTRGMQRTEVDAFNESLRARIALAISARRKELETQQGVARSLGARIKPVADSPASPRPRAEASSTTGGPKQWDVFVSYAGEDRDSTAKPLAEALRAAGLLVWFDKFELTLGDRLRRKIDEGLGGSRFGVVLLSHAFFSKHWPQQELDGLVQREVLGQKVILPIWCGLGRDEVAGYSTTLADRVATNWSDGIDTVVASILEVVTPAAR